MSGRRIADLLALASATRNIIRHNVGIQIQTASRAAVTSSITKTVRQSFRPVSSAQTQKPKTQVKEDTLLDGKDQDVFYEQSETHSADENKRTEELKIGESEESSTNEYIPKTASPSKSSKPTSPIQDHHIRKMSTHRSLPSETADDTNESSALRKNIDEEVFYDTTASTTPNKEFSPDHIPREAARPSSQDDKLHEGINSEVYYEQNDSKVKKSVKSLLKSLIPDP
jgi:hypothetical protein